MKTLNKFVSKLVDIMNGLNPVTEHIFCYSFRDSITSLSYTVMLSTTSTSFLAKLKSIEPERKWQNLYSHNIMILILVLLVYFMLL